MASYCHRPYWANPFRFLAAIIPYNRPGFKAATLRNGQRCPGRMSSIPCEDEHTAIARLHCLYIPADVQLVSKLLDVQAHVASQPFGQAIQSLRRAELVEQVLGVGAQRVPSALVASLEARLA